MLLAVDDGDRRAPVALTRDQPVPEPIRDCRPSLALLLEPPRHRRDALRRADPVEWSGVDHHALVVVGLVHRLGVARLLIRLHHNADGQAVGSSELEVALVVSGDTHHGAGAVLHQDIRRDEARHLLLVHRVHDVHAEQDAIPAVRLLPVGERRGLEGVGHGLHLRRRPTGLCQLRHQRVLDGEHEERHSPQRVRPGGEHLDLVAGLGDLELHRRALRTPDPVALHGDHAIGPVHQLVHVVQETLGVVGDLEEPLR